MKIKECSSPLAGLKTFDPSDYELEMLGLISYLLGTNSEGETGDWSHTDPGFVRGGAQRISRFGFYGRRLMRARRHHWIRHHAGSFREAYSCTTIVSPWASRKFFNRMYPIEGTLVKIDSWPCKIYDTKGSEDHKLDINIKTN